MCLKVSGKLDSPAFARGCPAFGTGAAPAPGLFPPPSFSSFVNLVLGIALDLGWNLARQLPHEFLPPRGWRGCLACLLAESNSFSFAVGCSPMSAEKMLLPANLNAVAPALFVGFA